MTRLATDQESPWTRHRPQTLDQRLRFPDQHAHESLRVVELPASELAPRNNFVSPPASTPPSELWYREDRRRGTVLTFSPIFFDRFWASFFAVDVGDDERDILGPSPGVPPSESRVWTFDDAFLPSTRF